MAFDLCVIPVSVVPYLEALQTRQFSMTGITAHLVSEKLTREQCRSMTPEIFASSYGSSSHALHVRSSVSSEINLAITSSVSVNAPSGYTIVIQGYLNDRNSKIVLGVCVSDEPIVADASLRMFVNIEETNNVFRLRADFDGMVTQGLLDDILEQSLEAYPTIALYNSSTKKITFKNASNTELPNMEIDASAFIKDGMVNDVVIQNGNLVVSFNTDAGKEDISIPLSSIFDSGNYYTKTQTDTQISTAIDALGSGSSKFVVAKVNTSYPSQISNLTDYRQPGTSSDNPHYNSKNASFMFDVSELPSNGTTFEVFLPSTSFVGSVQLVCGSSNYIYPIYFRGNDNVHCPTVPQGSVLRITFYDKGITFYDKAFYGDFYDLADFGDEHEAYVYVGKVPVAKSGHDLYAFSGLVGIDRDTGKFSQLFTVNVTDNGAGVTSPRLKENSPIYACFQGDCFSAHPKVPFGNILRIHDRFYDQGTLFTPRLPFTYYPFDDGDTVDAHVVESPNTNTSSPEKYKYFQVDNCPVYIQVESNRVLLGNPPADVPARLIGFMCSGAKNAGMIRLVESSDVSYMSDNEYSKTFAGVWDDNSVDTNTYSLSNVSTSLSYMSDNVLVGLSKNSSKLVPLLVDGACNGDVTINPNLDWDSPVYVLFKNFRCFSAHPMVDFRQVLKFDNGSFMFTFSPMGSVGSETPSVADGADGNQYFGSANYPVFISDFHGSNSGYKSFCVGIPSDVNIPSSDLHWRLLGYTTSKPGYIRLTESHPFLKDFIHQTGGYVKLSDFDSTTTIEGFTPSRYVKYIQETNPEYNLTKAVQELVSKYGEDVFHIKDLNASSVSASESNGEVYVGLPHMTTIEFNNRVSFRTSADEVEVAYIDRNGVYHGRALEAETSKTSETSDTATRSNSATKLNVSNGGSTLASFTYGSNTWDTDKGINPTTSNTLSLGSSSNVWKDVYGYTLHAWGNSASSGLRLCDGNFESIAYSSITGYASGRNGQMKFHHYNAYDGIDYVVTSTGPNTETSTTAATLLTEPQSTGTWTVGSSTYKLAAVYANTFYGNLSGNADTATKATQDGYGNTITSTYGSYLKTYTRATGSSSTTLGSLSNLYIELCSNSGSSLGRVYISDVIANALCGYGGFGWGTSEVGRSTAGYRTYSSYGSVGSLGLFTVTSTSRASAGSHVAGTSLHLVNVCDYSQTSYPSSGGNTGLGIANIGTVHYGSTMSGTWYVLNGYGGFTTMYAWFVIAVRVY